MSFKNIFSHKPETSSPIIVAPNGAGGLGDQMSAFLAACKIARDNPGVEIHYNVCDFLDPDKYFASDIWQNHRWQACPIPFDILDGLLRKPPKGGDHHKFFELSNYDLRSLLKKFNIHFWAYFPTALYKYFAAAAAWVKYDSAGIAIPMMFGWNDKIPARGLIVLPMIDFATVPCEFAAGFELRAPLDDRNSKKLRAIAGTPNSICLHVRRGDYIRPPFNHRAVSANYIESAIREIMRRENWSNATVFIFCSDADWVKEKVMNIKIPGLKLDYVNINTEQFPSAELELMRNCNAYILSFGMFGEMAAFLNRGDTMIIKPDYDNPQHWE